MSRSVSLRASWPGSLGRTGWANHHSSQSSPGRDASRPAKRKSSGGICDQARIAPPSASDGLHPQGLGKNLYPDLSIRENIEFFGRLFGPSPRARIPYSGPSPQHRSHPIRGPRGQKPFRWDAAKAGPLLLPDPRPRALDPGSANNRRRSAFTAAVLGTVAACVTAIQA